MTTLPVNEPLYTHFNKADFVPSFNVIISIVLKNAFITVHLVQVGLKSSHEFEPQKPLIK